MKDLISLTAPTIIALFIAGFILTAAGPAWTHEIAAWMMLPGVLALGLSLGWMGAIVISRGTLMIKTSAQNINMDKWTRPYFFPFELTFFAVFVSFAWVLVFLRVGVPYIEIIERNPWPLITPAASSAIALYGFAITSFLAVAGTVGFVWWKVTLRIHCSRVLRECGQTFNHIFRNCVPPWLGLFGSN